MPKACRKSIRDIHKRNKPFGDKQTTLSQFFQSGNCLVCRQLTTQTVCVECRKDPQKSVALLKDRTRRLERKWDKFHKVFTQVFREIQILYTFASFLQICQLCCSVCSLEIACRSLDCPVFIKRVECDRDVNNLETTRVAIIELDDEF